MGLVDLTTIPYVEARWYYSGRRSYIRLLVVHTPEFPELNDGAERLANYFATTETQASVHCCVDSDSIVRSVQDRDTAFGAENANSDALHAELVGYAGQTVEEWHDDYSLAVVDRAAGLYAAWGLEHNIPPRRLSVEEIRTGQYGICSHGDVYRALGGREVRTDPGDNFPWDLFMMLVERYFYGIPEKTGASKDMYIAYTTYDNGVPNACHLIENSMATLEFDMSETGAFGLSKQAIDFRENASGSIPFLKVSPLKVNEFRSNYLHWRGRSEFVPR